MAISAAVTAAATIGGAVIGNQQKQKAKGQAGQAERDSQAAQDAADQKAKQQHAENIQEQAQAGAVARKALGGTIDDRSSGASSYVPYTGPVKPTGGSGGGGDPGFVHTTLMTQPIQRKALLGS